MTWLVMGCGGGEGDAGAGGSGATRCASGQERCGTDFVPAGTCSPVDPPARECDDPARRVDTTGADHVVGDGRITLGGGGAVRLITFDTADHDDVTINLTVQRLRLVNGNSADHGADSGGKDTYAGGGAIGLLGSTIEITDSTLVDNQAVGVDGSGNGGAIYLDGDGDSTARFCGLTVAGNVSTRFDGAMFRTADGPAQTTVFDRSTLDENASGRWQNVTVADNPGDDIELRILVDENATATVTNSIFQGCYRTLAGDHNLQWPAGEAECTPGIVAADPALGALEDRGGATLTLAPTADGPAAAAGSDCAATDQRGTAHATACTLGAHEFGEWARPQAGRATSLADRGGGADPTTPRPRSPAPLGRSLAPI